MRSWVPPAMSVLPLRATAQATGMGFDFGIGAIVIPFNPNRARPADRGQQEAPNASRLASGGKTSAAPGPQPRQWVPPALTKLPI